MGGKKGGLPAEPEAREVNRECTGSDPGAFIMVLVAAGVHGALRRRARLDHRRRTRLADRRRARNANWRRAGLAWAASHHHWQARQTAGRRLRNTGKHRHCDDQCE